MGYNNSGGPISEVVQEAVCKTAYASSTLARASHEFWVIVVRKSGKRDIPRRLDQAVGVAPFVVVPGENFDEISGNYLR